MKRKHNLLVLLVCAALAGCATAKTPKDNSIARGVSLVELREQVEGAPVVRFDPIDGETLFEAMAPILREKGFSPFKNNTDPLIVSAYFRKDFSFGEKLAKSLIAGLFTGSAFSSEERVQSYMSIVATRGEDERGAYMEMDGRLTKFATTSGGVGVRGSNAALKKEFLVELVTAAGAKVRETDAE
ncbi:hypothetical protein EOI86_06940 [Hwanghaeella grinnelliae]|uniref:Uncharacterized protein n=1 Tax=Hwanghaeella grinnelliae TaxID=2500179 RepID=A0A3S2VRU1_9PROT|nr:hypothetical protein [Hwanghaeella grinnelliae]RVU38989.1 hypothetical protein EOI86_06940 [Hwanghaeella grinnelliae]